MELIYLTMALNRIWWKMNRIKMAYLIIGIQAVIAILLWYISAVAFSSYQTVWAILLFIDLILTSLVVLISLAAEGIYR